MSDTEKNVVMPEYMVKELKSRLEQFSSAELKTVFARQIFYGLKGDSDFCSSCTDVAEDKFNLRAQMEEVARKAYYRYRAYYHKKADDFDIVLDNGLNV